MKIYIKEVAKAHGLTLIALAGRLGVTRQTLHYYCEQGDRNPVGQLEKIASAIGVPVVELFTDPEAEYVPPTRNTFTCPSCGAEIEVTIHKQQEK